MAEEKEINPPVTPEIEQRSLPEFERSTDHPKPDDTQIHSEQLRYENADSIYE